MLHKKDKRDYLRPIEEESPQCQPNRERVGWDEDLERKAGRL